MSQPVRKLVTARFSDIVRLTVLSIFLLAVAGYTSDSSAASFTPAQQKVIEGAKKEGGVVNIRLLTGATAKSIQRLENEIFKWSGVRLTINNLNLTEPLAQAVLENRAGVQPTFDMAVDTTQAAVEGAQAGVFDVVDWRSILTKDTPKEGVYDVKPYGQIAIMQSSTSGIWVYNPKHVDGGKIKSWADLARPEWNGKVGLPPYSSYYARAAYMAGKDKIFPAVAAMIKNGAFIGNYAKLQERYRLGELWVMKSTDSDQTELERQGVPAKWEVLDFVDEDMRVYVMPKKAPHPNSAKLLAIYIVSPAGAKWLYEEHGSGNFLYAGGLASEIRARGKKLGVPVVQRWADPGLLKFQKTKEYKSWRKEIGKILRAN